MANHGFNIALATKISMEAAVLFDNFYFWCSKNRANKCEDKFHNGLYWTYNTIKSYEKQFPYLNGKKIIAAIEKLEEAGLIVSGCFNANKYDRTKWYAVTELGNAFYEDKITIDQIDFEKKVRTRSENKKANPNSEDDNSICLFGQMNLTDTDTYTNSDTINSSSVANAPSSEFANDESARVSEGSDDTSSSLTISEESHTHSDNTKSNVVSSSTTEERKVVPSSDKEFWGSLEDLETPKAEPKTEKKPRNYFKVPTIGEIAQYISENNYLVDAEGFYHYYRDRNWCAGRKKIDWKDKVRQWDLDRRAKGKNYGYKKQPASPYNLDIKNQSFSEENWK